MSNTSASRYAHCVINSKPIQRGLRSLSMTRASAIALSKAEQCKCARCAEPIKCLGIQQVGNGFPWGDAVAVSQPAMVGSETGRQRRSGDCCLEPEGRGSGRVS